jgi:deazaflavin-dependent oxidoreductase (nitroreductase family)
VRLSQFLRQVVRYFNPVTAFLLATPLHVLMSRRLAILSFTGRKSGRSYMTPVSYVRDGTAVLVPGGGMWWKNLRDGSSARILLRGEWKTVTPEVIGEPVALAQTLRGMLAANPALGVFMGIKLGPDGQPDSVALERERVRGFVVVRLRLDTESDQASKAAA